MVVAIPICIVIVVGMSLGIGVLAAAGAAAALLTGIAFPYAGLAVLAFMMSLKPPPVIPAPGLDFFLVGAILLGCLYRLPIDRPQARTNLPLLILGAYGAYAGLQQLPELASGYSNAADHEVGFLYIQFLTGIGLVVAAAYLLRRQPSLPILAMAMAGATLAALIAIATYDNPPVGPPFAGLVARPDDVLRAAGPFANPNYLGALVAMASTAGLSLLGAFGSRWSRALLLGTVAVAAIALLLSQSRSAVVAAFVGLAVFAFARNRTIGIAVVGIGILVAVVLYPIFVEWRLANLGVARASAIVGSDEARLGGALAGPQLFLSAPLFGIGFGHYSAMSVHVPGIVTPINSHNWYVTVLAEQGLVGVVLWTAFAVSLVHAIRVRPPEVQRMAWPVVAALATAGLFLEAPTTFQMIGLPCLLIVAALRGNWGTARSIGPTSDRARMTGASATGGS